MKICRILNSVKTLFRVIFYKARRIFRARNECKIFFVFFRWKWILRFFLNRWLLSISIILIFYVYLFSSFFFSLSISLWNWSNFIKFDERRIKLHLQLEPIILYLFETLKIIFLLKLSLSNSIFWNKKIYLIGYHIVRKITREELKGKKIVPESIEPWWWLKVTIRMQRVNPPRSGGDSQSPRRTVIRIMY